LGKPFEGTRLGSTAVGGTRDLAELPRTTRVRVFGFTTLSGCWVSMGDGTFVRESDTRSPWFDEDECRRVSAGDLSRHETSVLIG
jgi:hypothetical protein